MVTALQLFEARYLWQVEGLTQLDACLQAGISHTTLWQHRREGTEEWRESTRLLSQALTNEELTTSAQARAERILNAGQDSAAAMLITRILGLKEKHELSGALQSVPMPIFSEDDPMNHYGDSDQEPAAG